DPVIGDLFTGIGHQTSGEVFILPSSPWIGNYDSLASTAVTNMFATTGEVISYRYTGAGDNYKVYNDFWPIDYIVNPADSTIDQVAVDSLVEDVLVWFGFGRSGISDRTVDPGNVVKLLPVGIITNEAMIKFSLPSGMVVSLDIYDNTGRLIKNLKEGMASAGLNTVRWDGKDSYGNRIASGVYFYRLGAEDKTLTNKMVVIK
ncbi:T9SS type A sorting domain-containing protein, partial [candidate division WOR-3 bacterium]|nr:T9SS type A sorting domain-containing protein [candidate division WOR-3 bacterium]